MAYFALSLFILFVVGLLAYLFAPEDPELRRRRMQDRRRHPSGKVPTDRELLAIVEGRDVDEVP